MSHKKVLDKLFALVYTNIKKKGEFVMSRKADEGRKDLKEIEDARAAARRKINLYRPDELRGNVACHLDQNTFNNDLRNLAIMSKSDHVRLCALLRHHKIPKGKISKQFALALRYIGKIKMIHPIKNKKLSLCGFKLS